jgi:hypothetical protein
MIKEGTTLPQQFKSELHNLPLSKQKVGVIKIFRKNLNKKIEINKEKADLKYLNMRQKQFEAEVKNAHSEAEVIEIMFRWSAK